MSDVGFGFTGSSHCLQQTQSGGREFARPPLHAELWAATVDHQGWGFPRCPREGSPPFPLKYPGLLGQRAPPPASGDEGHSEPWQPQPQHCPLSGKSGSLGAGLRKIL